MLFLYQCTELVLDDGAYVPCGSAMPVRAEHQNEAACVYRAYVDSVARRSPAVLVEIVTHPDKHVEWWAFDSSCEPVLPGTGYDVAEPEIPNRGGVIGWRS